MLHTTAQFEWYNNPEETRVTTPSSVYNVSLFLVITLTFNVSHIHHFIIILGAVYVQKFIFYYSPEIKTVLKNNKRVLRTIVRF